MTFFLLIHSSFPPPSLSLFQDQHSVVGQNAGPSPSPNPCSNPNTGSGYMNSQQSLLNQQLMGKKQTLQRQIMEQKQQLLLQQQMLADAVKRSPNSYRAYLLAQQREYISFHFYLLPLYLCPSMAQQPWCLDCKRD